MAAPLVILHSPRDDRDADMLQQFLAPAMRHSNVKVWDRRNIPPGTDRRAATHRALLESDIVVVLLSADLLNDEDSYAWSEMALQQQRRRGAVLIPVLLRPCLVDGTPFAALKLLPDNGKPLSTWPNRDEAFLEVANDVLRVLSFGLPAREERGSRPDSGPKTGQPPTAVYPLRKIFSPNELPQLTYVEPEQMSDLLERLRCPREGLVLEGPSGIGKTTALEKALAQLSPARVSRIVGTDPEKTPEAALEQVLALGFLQHGGHLVVDDFHRIEAPTRRRLANLMKYVSDRGPEDAKVTLVGVNMVGESLLQEDPDLAGRYEKVSLRRQSDAKIAEMIRTGERAANIEFARPDRFIELASGSFFVAQLLCYQAALDAGLRETAPAFRVLEGGPDGQTLDKVFARLSGRFHDLLVTFATCDETSPPRGAGLTLLWLLSKAPDSLVKLEVVRSQYQHPLSEALAWMERGALLSHFKTFPRLREILHYNPERAWLSAEDPRLTFYLRNLPWEAFLRDTRHPHDKVRWDPKDGPLFPPFATVPVERLPRVSEPAPLPPSVLLHLSDLHFQNRSQASLWFDQLAEDLRRDLKVDPGALDLVLLTGDLTDKGKPEGYTAAQQFLADLQDEFKLAPDQVVIVPGNHDLDLSATRVPEDQRFLRFADFYRAVRPDAYPLLEEQQFTLHHVPGKRLLVLGLNSAWDIDGENPGRASINGVALGRALRQIRNSRAYDHCLKIAVWHHPIQSAGEDRIRDTGFLEVLAKSGFRLGLHGHMHEAQPYLFSYDRSFDGRRVDLLGAGTFGAAGPERPTGIPLQYQVLRLGGRALQVETRRREKPEGSWQPDARWQQGPTKPPLPSYSVLL